VYPNDASLLFIVINDVDSSDNHGRFKIMVQLWKARTS